MRNPLKLFKISEKEKKKILEQHINATKKQYLSEKDETKEIYSFSKDYEGKKGYSDIDDQDFFDLMSKGDIDLGFDAVGVADIERMKKDKGYEREVKKPKEMNSGEMKESYQYSVPSIIKDLKDATEITDEMIDLIMNGDEEALLDAETMFGYTDEGRVRRGILDKLDYLYGISTGI